MQLQMIEKARANRVSALDCLTAKNASGQRQAPCKSVMVVSAGRARHSRFPGSFGVFKSHRTWQGDHDGMAASNLVDFPQPAI